MPELPEVETIRRQLEESVIGAVITDVVVRRANCYVGLPFLTDETITKVLRIGKYLFVNFSSGRGFVIHLKMTGRLVVDVASYDLLPHTRVVIQLANGQKIYYWDARTFGYVKYVDDIRLEHERQKSKIGPDPWEITEDDFYKLMQKYKRPVKNLILDQALLSGVGNIYANDGLWEAEIDPRRLANSLTKKESKKLLGSLRHVMERGLITGGASDNSYVNALGEKGSYQDEFRVYKRTGKPCLKCGQKLVRVVVGGRGTWLCETCQK
jgi:formamidopyrimidine-DNA glycosylase